MQNHAQDAKGRGRPPKQRGDKLLTREMLVHVGTEVLTEKGYSAVGVDEILQRTGISRCSFYYYFKTKEGFGAELIDRYRLSITQKLERCLCDPSLSPLDGLRAFVGGVRDEMARAGCRSGCLIGKLAQEVNTLPENFREQLSAAEARARSRGQQDARDGAHIHFVIHFRPLFRRDAALCGIQTVEVLCKKRRQIAIVVKMVLPNVYSAQNQDAIFGEY